MGHREADIGDYGLDKFRAYVRAAQRLRAQDSLRNVSDLNAAIASALGEGKAVQAYIDKMIKTAT